MTHSFQCRSCHFSALHWNDTTPMHARPIFTHVSFFIRYHVIFHPKNDIFHVSFFENWHFSYIIFPVSRHFSSEKWHFSYIIFRKMSFFIYHFSSGIKSFFIFHPVSRRHTRDCAAKSCSWHSKATTPMDTHPVSTHISIWYILKRAYISSFGVDVCGSFADMQGSFADM